MNTTHIQTLSDLQAIDLPAQAAQALALTLSLAQINSGSSHIAGVIAVQQQLQARLEALGLDCHLQKTAEPQAAPVLLAQLNPTAKQRLLLVGHADTVFPADSPFQSITQLDELRLRGPGLADMKGGLAVMLAALENALPHFQQQAMGVDVLINGDEETGSLHSRPLIEHYARQACAALVYEPVMSSGALAGARAASANISYHFTGLAAHAGREFHAGRNAVNAAAQLAFAVDAIWRQYDDVTLNNAALHGGDTFNTVPAEAVLRINGRSRDQQQLEQALQAVEHAAQAIAAERAVQVQRQGGIHRPAKMSSSRQQYLEQCITQIGAQQGLNLQFQDTNGVCDGNIIAHVGTPVVDTMGVRGGLIHTHDEFLEVDSIAERMALNTAVYHHFNTHTLQEVSLSC